MVEWTGARILVTNFRRHRGITLAELAEKLSMNTNTLYRKLNSPGKITAEELGKMIEIFQLSKTDALRLMSEVITWKGWSSYL